MLLTEEQQTNRDEQMLIETMHRVRKKGGLYYIGLMNN